ncbi:MAG: S9 family peptidase [Gemmatimonadetes bacterium]|nr:S9 family peptidase [Gemmatimonadota bacterium]
MRRFRRFVLSGLFTAVLAPIAAAGGQQSTTPPMAQRRPHRLEMHGDVRVDDYFWLRERENPEVIAYLEAENAWTQAVMAHTEALQVQLFEEIKGRIKQDDSSVPYLLDGYWYYTRYEDGKEYPIYCRKRGSLDAEEEIILDVNPLAQGHGYYAASGRQVSVNGEILAFAADTVGRRKYTILFKDLRTGEMLDDVLPMTTSNLTWANDNRTVFYTRQDPETLRWYRIYRHTLGTDPAQDERVYEEPDETFRTFVFRTKSRRYIMIGSSQTLATEYRYVDADRPDGTFTIILPREREHEYQVDHFGDYFYIRTNDQAENFRLVRAPVATPSREHWEEVIGHRDDVLFEDFDIFSDYLVVTERRNGLIELRVRPWNGEDEHYIDFDEPTYMAYTTTNLDFDTRRLRFGYTSLTTPTSTYDYDMASRERTLLKRTEVLGQFDPADYATERIYAWTHDGVRVPISLVYRRDRRHDGPNQLLLYAYGSYGFSMDARFSSPRLSLLDRGFIYAIAHIRGGSEMGRWWYEQGKLFHKRNTFTDFIAAADYLVREGYTSPDMLYAQGGSAGGLLMGAIANMRPDLFDGIVARVPWVDVVTTMLDASIPLTTSEYDEWGDPNDRNYYEYMLSYSPYDNVTAQDYPHMLVTTGLHDSQVQYWEPAKWVARLRALKTDDNRLLLKTNLEAGHGGASGRYRRYRETAFVYAFLLDLAGLAPVP